MIEERINNSLRELEQGLKNVESARKQVEKTVSSYGGLNQATTEYVNQLSAISGRIRELVESIGSDYSQKVREFEKDRATIVKASNNATEKLANATDEFKDSLYVIETKLKYSLIVNAVSLLAIAGIVFMLLK